MVAMLGLLLLGGAGAAMAIVIHIRQGNQVTTIQPPPGSTVRIGADGNVDVELPRPSGAVRRSDGRKRAGGLTRGKVRRGSSLRLRRTGQRTFIRGSGSCASRTTSR